MIRLFKNITIVFFSLFLLSGTQGGGEEIIELKTDFGTIYLWLYKDTPKHRENFLKLTKEGFYTETIFHRVIKEFMIQGGDPNTKDSTKTHLAGQGGPGYTIEAEFKIHHYHKRGALAAARQGDAVNPEQRSSGSQFYIVQGNKIPSGQLQMIEKSTRAKSKYKDYKMPEKAKYEYEEIGGAPMLDMQYTVFGEVISGMDVVDKIAETKVNRGNKRPREDIKMKVTVKKISKKKLKKDFNFEVPTLK